MASIYLLQRGAAIKSSSYDVVESTVDYGTNVVAKNLASFISNTNLNGGYYIGRYEVSSVTQNEITRFECKKDESVWSSFDITQASNLCQTMYTSKPFTSDLINSYAWDTAIIFIQTFSSKVDYYNQNNSIKIGKTGETNDEALHINDMSSNALEMTTEVYSPSQNYYERNIERWRIFW